MIEDLISLLCIDEFINKIKPIPTSGKIKTVSHNGNLVRVYHNIPNMVDRYWTPKLLYFDRPTLVETYYMGLLRETDVVTVDLLTGEIHLL